VQAHTPTTGTGKLELARAAPAARRPAAVDAAVEAAFDIVAVQVAVVFNGRPPP